jgi:hypothetical protein
VRPLDELDLGDELRRHPDDVALAHLRHLRHRSEGRRRPLERPELAKELLDFLLGEAGPAVSRPDELVADAVREDEATARGLGISAVPFFVIDRRFGLAGAQPPEVIGEGLRRAWEARTPLAVVAEGDACGPDGC